MSKENKCAECQKNLINSEGDKEYYALNKGGEVGKETCLDCWNKNQKSYKRDYETITYLKEGGYLERDHVSGSRVIYKEIKNKCPKCGTCYFLEGEGSCEQWRHKVMDNWGCWEKDKCRCIHIGDNLEDLPNMLIKDCPRRYECLSDKATDEDKRKLQEADLKWDVKNNKHKEDNQDNHRERERESKFNGEYRNWRI